MWFLLDKSDIPSFERIGGYVCQETDLGNELRETVNSNIRQLNGVQWEEPVIDMAAYMSGDNRVHFFEHFLRADHRFVLSEEMALSRLNEHEFVYMVIEPQWMPAYKLFPVDGVWSHVENIDACIFSPSKELILVLDHEGFGPFDPKRVNQSEDHQSEERPSPAILDAGPSEGT